MAIGRKTGGRVPGSVDLKPRKNARATRVVTNATTTVGAAAGGAPPLAPASSAQARDAPNASVAGFLAAMARPTVGVILEPAPAVVDVPDPWLAGIAARGLPSDPDPPTVDVLQPPRRTGPRKPRAYEVARKAATEAKRAAVEARSRATDDMVGAGSGATVAAAARGNGNASNGFPRHRIVATDSLIGYANNPRTHSPAQIDKLVASIKEFGFTNPILTDGKKGVVAGHGRLLAAVQMGLATVPTVELSHLTAKQRRAYVIADNKLALNSSWDEELLTLELGDLHAAGFDLHLTGFDGDELLKLFGDEGGGGAGSGSGDDEEIHGNVCCPACGHEFPTVAKAFRRIANKQRKAA
jgi:hypothetical protein